MRIKRKSKKVEQPHKLILSEIIGLTTTNASGLASNISIGDCVYLAGCVVVVYNVGSGSQAHLMTTSRTPKPLSCVAVSHRDGYYIAAGESGHQPAVLVWDYSDQSFLVELKDHQYGVSCIDFSPDGKHLVSAGFPHDGYICFWDWRSTVLVTKVRASSAISSLSFSSGGSFFITAGKKHLKLWMVGSSSRNRSKTSIETLSIDGKPANLGCQKGSSFTSVISAARTMPSTDQATELSPIYALTDAGVLCLLHSGFSLRKWVDLEVEKGFALASSDSLVACACSNGIVRLFMLETLKYVGSLPYSETNGLVGDAEVDLCEKSSKTKLEHAVTFPDSIACQFSSFHKLVVVYGDHSLCVWDVQDIPKVSKCQVLFPHSACIWDVKNLPCQNLQPPHAGCHSGVSFATCSADRTIRLWNRSLESDSERNEAVLVGTINIVSTGEQDTVDTSVAGQGFRSMGVSSDGKYLAAGDCRGNLHVYNLHTSDYASFQEAHDAEILSLSFSSSSRKNASPGQKSKDFYLLASGGRDRMIHVYDVKRGFNLVESLEDHSAAVTSVKLTCNGSKLLSCSADRSVLFRDVAITDAGWIFSRRHHQIASHGTIYDMAIDPSVELAVTVGQDKKIKTFDLATGKLIRTFKQDGDFGEPIKVSIDPSGSYLVCSYSNKSMAIYNFTSGELITQAMGHAEVITGIIFLPDCEHIISVGGDSCIFIWKLPALMSRTISQKITEHAGSSSPANSSLSVVPSEGFLHEVHQSTVNLNDTLDNSQRQDHMINFVEDGGFGETSAFKFSISRLPGWAKNKVTNAETPPGDPGLIQSQEVESESSPSITTGSSANIGCSAEFHTPCHVYLGGARLNLSSGRLSHPHASKSSPSRQEIRSFVRGRQWKTIHTVLLDAMDSPIVNDFKDENVQISVPNLGAELDGPGEGINSRSGDLIVIDHLSVQPIHEQPLVKEASYDGNGFELAQIAKDGIESSDGQCEGNDLFSQHFGNLSTTPKLNGSRSSARHSLSACFVACREHFKPCQSLFSMQMENSSIDAFGCSEENIHQNSSEDLSAQLPTESQPSEIQIQDFGNSTEDPMNENTESPDKQALDEGRENQERIAECKAALHGLDEERENQERIAECKAAVHSLDEERENQDRIAECKAALHGLDASVDTTLELFARLKTPAGGEEISSKLRAELSDLAKELLPGIMEKVQGLTDLAQGVGSSERNPCLEKRVEDFDLEPLVGRFAESLSRQVLELVRKNL